jgi:ABC-type branched-subunit amino acid transport system ATPase component
VTNQSTPVIEITGLHKSFGDLHVLRGVDLTARAGDVVSLIGSSGSGKSTLLRCANLLEDSQQGEILFEGEPVSWRGTGPARRPADAEQVRRIRTNLSMVFQQFNLWAHLTILQNVMEAPVTVLGQDRPRSRTARGPSSTRSASTTSATPSPRSFRVASSSAPPSPARSAWNPARFSSTNPPPPSTPSSNRRSCASSAASPKRGAPCFS